MNKKGGKGKLGGLYDLCSAAEYGLCGAPRRLVGALGGKAKVSVPLRVGDKTKRANQAARPR